MSGREQLVVESVSAGYSAGLALRDVSLSVTAGGICAVLGRNGAGKTTLARVIMGELQARSGRRQLDGTDLPRASWRTSRRGLAMVPEGRGIVAELTVEENLLLGARCQRAQLRAHEGEVFARFPALASRRGQVAGTLSGGEQQMLALARAIVSRPRFVLLDEPTLGLAPRIVDSLWAAIVDLASSGLGILLLEQNAHRALEIAHQAIVLNTGAAVASGTPEELRDSAQLRSSFLD